MQGEEVRTSIRDIKAESGCDNKRRPTGHFIEMCEGASFYTKEKMISSHWLDFDIGSYDYDIVAIICHVIQKSELDSIFFYRSFQDADFR